MFYAAVQTLSVLSNLKLTRLFLLYTVYPSQSPGVSVPSNSCSGSQAAWAALWDLAEDRGEQHTAGDSGHFPAQHVSSVLMFPGWEGRILRPAAEERAGVFVGSGIPTPMSLLVSSPPGPGHPASFSPRVLVSRAPTTL